MAGSHVGSVMRGLVDPVASQSGFDQILHLTGHAQELSGQPVDLPALFNNHAIQFLDRMIGVSKIYFQLLNAVF